MDTFGRGPWWHRIRYLWPSSSASLPLKTLGRGDKPSAAAYRAARLSGEHVGEETLRRRARLIQNLMQTAGQMIRLAATAIGSACMVGEGIVG